MVIARVLQHSEQGIPEQYLFEQDNHLLASSIEIDKHFKTRMEAVGACILTVVDFDTTDYGLGQWLLLRKGSEYAQRKGLGQHIPTQIEQGSVYYQSEFLTTVLSADSYTPEKLITFGYVARSLIPESCKINFVEVL
jgi:hypothetical protein